MIRSASSPRLPQANTLDTVIERFGDSFPPTKVFSDHARLTLAGVEPRDDPDAALVAWLNHEEAMFRRLERKLVVERLGQGSGDPPDVDAFLGFSLQVQNRRKSRMGRAFENHLDAIFTRLGLRFTAQAVTEGGNTADFLFPGLADYRDPGFPDTRLAMLAAKSTCKDRWRQVLPEARRIWPKHLITLEPAISSAQTDQMAAERIRLVVPASIQTSYQPPQRAWLMSLRDFVGLVSARQ